MQRRTLLKLGVGATVTLVVAGGGVALLRPGLDRGRLTTSGREVFSAVARAVLDGSLPTAASARVQVLTAHLRRLDDTLAALPAAVQAELSQLLAMLAIGPGRIVFAGLYVPWSQASVEQVQSSLQSMRTSSIALKQQAYHALRDLTNASYYADPDAWPLMGYPGPRALS